VHGSAGKAPAKAASPAVAAGFTAIQWRIDVIRDVRNAKPFDAPGRACYKAIRMVNARGRAPRENSKEGKPMAKRNLVGILCLSMVLIVAGVVSAGQIKPRPGEYTPTVTPPALTSSTVKTSPAYYPVLLSDSMPGPWGVGVTDSGAQVYVNCPYNFQIRKWEGGVTSVVLDTATGPCAGKWRSDIGFFFGDFDGTIFHCLMDGPMLKTVGSTGPGFVSGLDIDPASATIYFINNDQGKLYSLPNFDGHMPYFIAAIGPESSWGLAVKGDYIYFSYYYSGTVVRIPKRGGRARLVASGLGGPCGLDFDKKGTLYIADYEGGRILRIAKGSRTPQVIASGFGWPFYVTVDDRGDVYFTDFATSSLWKLTRKVPIK
jgi:DNA-binding beta-propeller fold protein YncE